MIGGKILDKIEIKLRGNDDCLVVHIDVFDNNLSRKWLKSLNQLLDGRHHLEKNYCFLGFPDSKRNGPYILDQINKSIDAINQADIGYQIDDYFDMSNCISDDPKFGRPIGRNIIHDKFNWLHRYFEDLQGVSGSTAEFFERADTNTRWHIRQLNLLCHEFESWALSYRKQIEAPDWICPSQLMCWLNAPRFVLDENDFDLFGIETLNRTTGGVYVGVNKAVGKHHWEVFNDEGRDISELVSSTLRSQTEASGDFDIEWGRSCADFEWQKKKLSSFKEWLKRNGFDPQDPALTIGHPRVGQVDLMKSFGTDNTIKIWNLLSRNLDVIGVSSSDACAEYDYRWDDDDYIQLQIGEIAKGYRQ